MQKAKYAVFWRPADVFEELIMQGCSTGVCDKKYRSENGHNKGSKGPKKTDRQPQLSNYLALDR